MNTVLAISKKLFYEEKLFVIVSLLGFLLAGVCTVYVVLMGEVVLPEGNVQSAASFNAAIALFILSIAAIMPVSDLSLRHRRRMRRGLALSITIGYTIETIQHLRGYNPRFTREGTLIDTLIGAFFGLICLVILYYTIILAISFFRSSAKHPLLTVSIRYAFLSTMIASAAGIVMSILQNRYIGASGNMIIVHGLGYHALQALPILGWLLERCRIAHARARLLNHLGCSAWMIGLMLACLQTMIGRTLFAWGIVPVLTSIMLGLWLITTTIVSIRVIRPAFIDSPQATDL